MTAEEFYWFLIIFVYLINILVGSLFIGLSYYLIKRVRKSKSHYIKTQISEKRILWIKTILWIVFIIILISYFDIFYKIISNEMRIFYFSSLIPLISVLIFIYSGIYYINGNIKEQKEMTNHVQPKS